MDKNIGMVNKYQTLVNILDQLRRDAPVNYKKYYPLESDIEKLNQARSKAFIHLFLKVKFGMLDFLEREKYITEGSYDGGVDAYYIDYDKKVIYFIQSKFRSNDLNFVNKEIELSEILNMDIDRIVIGENTDENENKYNSKILEFIKCLKEIDDIARYRYEIIIMANLNGVSVSQLKKLTGGYSCKVFNYEKCYDELVFTVVSGTYYNESDLYINIYLTNRDFTQSRINYPVKTKHNDCEITILFVPTIEIAKILYKYKNSILKYNPRSYLDISNNPVNKEIAKTIQEESTNEFSLFNNGITILSDETSINEKIGVKGKGQMHIKNPQIINGGQTAYTLSKIYEDNLLSGFDNSIFETKEVMLKVITFLNAKEAKTGEILSLIEEISKATNQQTAVNDADRRSNDRVQIELQKIIYDEFGYFYERKRGEFYDGLKNKYIDRNKIVDRETFLRVCYAICGSTAQARRNSDKVLFKKDSFDQIIADSNKANFMFFSYMCYKKLDDIQKKFSLTRNKFGVANYGNALRYGKMAVITAISLLFEGKVTNNNVDMLIDQYVNGVINMWIKFEEYVKIQDHNKDYFSRYIDQNTGNEVSEVNFDGYYKGRTINYDIKRFFNKNLKSAFEEVASVGNQ